MRHGTGRVNYQSSSDGPRLEYKPIVVCKKFKNQFSRHIPYITAGKFSGQHESKSQDVSDVGPRLSVPGHIE